MSDVTVALQIKLGDLKTEKEIILETRDAEIEAARGKYATSLKEVNAKIGKTSRMILTAEKL